MKTRVLSLILFSILVLTTGTARAQMKAHFINVGQADSILLEFKSAAILIDAGGESTGDDRDVDHLIGYLNTFFQTRPDLNRTLYSIIISHPHIDHTKNLTPVMTTFRVRNLVDGGNQSGSGIGPLRSARRRAQDNNILYNKIEDREILEGGYTTSHLGALKNSASNVDVRFLAGYRSGDCEDANNDSLVVRVQYGQKTFIFTGDAETEDERCFPQVDNVIDWYAGTLLDVDVYKVGHHGSGNGTSEAFMREMSPEISVISAGHRDTQTPGPFHAFQFGHPRESAVSMIEAGTSGTRDTPVTAYTMNGVRDVFEDRRVEKAVYCTCWDGDIVISTNVSGTQLSTQFSGR